METNNKALCVLGKTQKNRPSDSQMFSGKAFYTDQGGRGLVSGLFKHKTFIVHTYFYYY